MGDSAASVVDPVMSVVGPVAGIVQDEREHERAKDNRREQRASLDDLAYRREATYRNSRMALQGAIEDFYRQKGWAIPERLPGAFTARGLPGEPPLYPGVSKENPELQESSEADDTEAQQIANSIDKDTPKLADDSERPTEERPAGFNLKVADIDPGARELQALKDAPKLDVVRGQRPVSSANTLDAESLLYIPDRRYAATEEILPLLSRRR